jgi:hypothetical protein
LTFRNTTPRDLLTDARDAITGTARRATGPAARAAMAHAARDARTHGTRVADRARHTSKPVRYTAGIAAATTIATLAGTLSASAATGPADAYHTAPATTSHAPASSGSHASGQSGPTTIYDSTSPSSVPAGQHVAAYSNGAYQATSSQVQGRGNVLWIDTNGSDPHASALDVEPGDATPAQAAQWVSAKLTASPHSDAIVYTFKSNWAAVQDSIRQLPQSEQTHVKYWIADPTGTPHIVPGAAATQWYWGPSYDITQATPSFFSQAS